MAITKFTESVNNIQNLSDNPNTSGMTAAELKARFDKAGTDIKNYINDTLTEEMDTLNTTTSSSIGTLTNLNTTTKTDLVSALNEVNNKLDDTGWQTLTLESGVSTGQNGRTPSYRRIGNVVFIEGSFSFTKGNSSQNLATIPEGYRPSTILYISSNTSGSRTARTYISTGGAIGCDWIYNLNNTSSYTGSVSWYTVEIAYVID